jgi:hypothetical protein
MTPIAGIPRLICMRKGAHMIAMARYPWRTRLLAALLLSVLPLAGAAAQGGGGSIRGIVFLDENEDGVWGAGEAPLEGVAIMLSNGDGTTHVLSAGDGSFLVEVGEGEWQGVVLPPEGYLPTNDATRNVTISPEGILEAVMDFGLIRVTSGQDDPAASEEQAPEAELGSEAPEGEAAEAAPSAEEVGGAGDEGLAETVGEAGGESQLDAKEGRVDSVLPLSGSSRPLVLLTAGLGLAGAAGLALIWVGRRLH